MKKINRIKKNEEIANIVLKKQKIKSQSFFIYYQKNTTITKVAISVSKKIGNSVKRNHAKRIIREIIREFVKTNISVSLVIVVKKDLSNEKFINLKEEMDNCFNNLLKRMKNYPKPEEK